MKEAGIQSNITKKYRPTTSQTPVEERKNVLEQNFIKTSMNDCCAEKI